METLLVISGAGLPAYSARGCTQTLQPIDAAAQNLRTVNGELIDVSAPQFRKLKTSITCTDQRAPAFAKAWPGRTVTIDCVEELCQEMEDSTDDELATDQPSDLEHEAVPGSVRVEGSFVFYRPRLVMLVTDWQLQLDEYGAEVGWELDAEEV